MLVPMLHGNPARIPTGCDCFVLKVCLSIMLLLWSSGAARAEGLNLLFFGNSFSIGNDLTYDVGRIAQADGHDTPTIVSDLAGGKDVDYHIAEVQKSPENNVAHADLAGGKWDFVIVQGYSTEATHVGDPEDFVDDMVTMANLVRNHANGQGAKLVLFETWARQPGHSFYPATFDDAAAMQAEIRTNYRAAQQAVDADAGKSVALYAPVGDAFEKAEFDGSLYGSDLYHASNAGSLLGSMMIYRTIYGEDVSDIEYSTVSSWAGVNEATWKSLAATADGTTLAPEPGTMAMVSGLGVLISLRLLRLRGENPTAD